MAAVLACGPGAVLSHRSAAELWALLVPGDGPIHVTVPTTAGRRRRPGLRDLRRLVSAAVVRRATRQAEYLGLDLGETDTDRIRSELERSFLQLCRRHRLPAPEVNAPIGPYAVDFLWRPQRLVVETDGYAAHRGRQAFEDDRARELYLHGRGLRVRRFSDRQIEHRAGEVAAAVRVELGC
jgi:very-short-patch-repair endonuclease